MYHYLLLHPSSEYIYIRLKVKLSCPSQSKITIRYVNMTFLNFEEFRTFFAVFYDPSLNSSLPEENIQNSGFFKGLFKIV